jgi:hypothetical protein
MKPNTRIKILLFALSIALVMLACNIGSSAEPTLTPTEPPPPTATAVPPTDTPEPTPTEEIVEAPVEEPVEEPVPADTLAVVEVVGFRDEYDSLRVVGLVTNNTDRGVDSVEVEVEVFDANGNSLYTDQTNTDLYQLAPGDTSPFSLWIFEDLPDADNFAAIIVGQSSSEIERTEVEFKNLNMVVDDVGNVHVTGMIANNGDQPVKLGGLAAATFDANGDLFSANGYSVMIRYLEPGEDGPFRISITSPAGGATDVDYQLYVDAEVYDTEDFYDISFSTLNHYIDVYGSFHLVGEVTNNSEETLSIELLGAIFDANLEENPDAKVIDAASTSPPIYGVAPGMTAPFDFDFWGPLNNKSGTPDLAAYYTIQWDPYWTWTSTTEYTDLTTDNDINDFDDYGGKFTGQVVNDTDAAVDGAVVIINLYSNETGELLITGYDSIFDPIEAGDSAIYEVYLDTPEGFDPDTVAYEIIAKGELP